MQTNVRKKAALLIGSIDFALKESGRTIDDFDLDKPEDRRKLVLAFYGSFPYVPVEVAAPALNIDAGEVILILRGTHYPHAFKECQKMYSYAKRLAAPDDPNKLTEFERSQIARLLLDNGFNRDVVSRVMYEKGKGSPAFTPFDPTQARGIIQIVLDYFGVTLADVASKSRHPNVTAARQVAAYMCHRFSHSSYPDINEMMGKRRNGHSTMIDGVQRLRIRMEKNEPLRGLPNIKSMDAVLEIEAKVKAMIGGNAKVVPNG